MIKTISTDKAPAAIGPYSQAKIVENMLYSSGQIPIVPETGEIIEGDITAQTHRAIQNVGEILKEAGTDYSAVVKTTCFLADMNDFAAMNAVYSEFFTENCPARSAVQVARLPKDVKVEIEAIAFI